MRLLHPAWALGCALLATALPGAAGEIRVTAGNTAYPAYLPRGASPKRPCPLLVIFHGQGGRPERDILPWAKDLADREKVAILAPRGDVEDGQGHTWSNAPEAGERLARAIRDLLAQRKEIDPGRIVWIGMSAGTFPCCEFGAPRTGTLCHGIVLCAVSTASLQASGTEAAPKPRVAAFLGTRDFNFPGLERFRADLKTGAEAYAMNQITDLPHEWPAYDYLCAGIRWVLQPGNASEDNTLPKTPPSIPSLRCRHLLLRHRGAEDAPPACARAPEEALAEAQRLQAELKAGDPAARRRLAETRTEDAATRGNQGLLLAEADALRFGDLLRWGCWTAGTEPRLLRSPWGVHVVWRDP